MGVQKGVNGGADGVRTRDLIDAIDARSQLRYGPTVVRGDSLITSGHALRQTSRVADCYIAPSPLNLRRLRAQTDADFRSTFVTCWPAHFLLCLKRIRALGV
jgi:hypothetical protein